MNLTHIKFIIRRLSLNQLRKLDAWLVELIRKTEEASRKDKPSPRKQTVAKQTLDNKTYRLEYIRCGKENCKCTRGKLHGPYWYSYARVKDKTTSQYIGKKLSTDVEKKVLYKSSNKSKNQN
jgi:hypothetical protein